MAYPSLVSSTAYEGASSTAFPIFSTLDLSNCDLAAVIVTKVGGGGFINPTGAGWLDLGPTASNGFFGASRIFYKIAPTNSETLSATGNAASAWEAVLLRFGNGANNLAGASNSVTTENPPSLDAGAVRDHLWVAIATISTTADYTAGPSGYSNFAYVENTGGAPGIAFATKAAHAQIEDPGGFTGGQAGRSTSWTLAIWAPSPAVTPAVRTAYFDETGSNAVTVAERGSRVVEI